MKIKSPLQASYSMRQKSGAVVFIHIKLTFANIYFASVIRSIHITEIGTNPLSRAAPHTDVFFMWRVEFHHDGSSKMQLRSCDILTYFVSYNSTGTESGNGLEHPLTHKVVTN